LSITISQLRGGAATALDTIAAIRTVYDYIPDTAPATPSAIVGNVSIEWDEANARGLDLATFSCYLVVSRMSERSGADTLDALLAGSGAGSVKTALESGGNLNGSCSTMRVTRATPVSLSMGGVEFFAYEYEVEAYG
jgi:hypothetical protein